MLRPPVQPSAPSLQTPTLPTGTVTFLLVDCPDDPGADGRGQGSAAALEGKGREISPAAGPALADQQPLLWDVVQQHRGAEVRASDGLFLAAFGSAVDALAGAVTIARATHGLPQRLRIALDTGEARLHKGEYEGGVLERALRILVAGYGGQILC